MLIFDVETLGVDSNAVILSAALLYADMNERKTYKELLEDACFVKFDAEEQIKKYDRKISKETLDWWSRQTDHAKEISFNPNKSVDVSVVDGLTQLSEYAKKYKKGTTVWARGNMDQSVIENLYRQANLEPFAFFNVWRDLRTAIDILYNSGNGYVDVSSEAPEFDKSMVEKHDPVHDCAYDAMMLYYGVAKE